MAVFTNLHHLSEVLAHRIAKSVEEAGESPLPAGTVQPGPPLENPTVPGDAVRVTLLYVSPSPHQRNAMPTRMADGRMVPAPLTLSATFLITCYGSNGQEDPVRAQQLLGHVLQGFYSSPTLKLPLADLPDCGEGMLEISQEPLDLERVERVLSPLQVRHRPFALYEVGPVLLQHLAPPAAAPPLVLPGGPRVVGPSVLGTLRLTGVYPTLSAPGGLLRLTGAWPGLPQVRVAGVWRTPTRDGADLLVTLPDPLAAGSYGLELCLEGHGSEVRSVLVDPTVPSLDAPTTAQPGPLLLTGRQLGMVTRLAIWPEAGVRAPSDLRFVFGTLTLGGLTVDLSGVPPGSWRLAAEWPSAGRVEYTPYVRLELRA